MNLVRSEMLRDHYVKMASHAIRFKALARLCRGRQVGEKGFLRQAAR
jgi:hypothetical protein